MRVYPRGPYFLGIFLETSTDLIFLSGLKSDINLKSVQASNHLQKISDMILLFFAKSSAYSER